MNSSYWQALFQAELGCVHGGRAGRREAVGKGKRLERIPDVVVNEVLAGAGCDAELTSATQKQKACSKAGFLNLAPLTGLELHLYLLLLLILLSLTIFLPTYLPSLLFSYQ
ncbi:hypothetical protein IE981_27645 [Klebsiella pneumoniae]|nr:hypothetical protein [Klebsiella pneumoniae]